jgi:hypothetical protein
VECSASVVTRQAAVRWQLFAAMLPVDYRSLLAATKYRLTKLGCDSATSWTSKKNDEGQTTEISRIQRNIGGEMIIRPLSFQLFTTF